MKLATAFLLTAFSLSAFAQNYQGEETKPMIAAIIERLASTQFKNCKVARDITGPGIAILANGDHGLRMTSDMDVRSTPITMQVDKQQPSLRIFVNGKLPGPGTTGPYFQNRVAVYIDQKVRDKSIKSLRFRYETQSFLDIGTIARPQQQEQWTVKADVTCIAN